MPKPKLTKAELAQREKEKEKRRIEEREKEIQKKEERKKELERQLQEVDNELAALDESGDNGWETTSDDENDASETGENPSGGKTDLDDENSGEFSKLLEELASEASKNPGDLWKKIREQLEAKFQDDLEQAPTTLSNVFSSMPEVTSQIENPGSSKQNQPMVLSTPGPTSAQDLESLAIPGPSTQKQSMVLSTPGPSIYDLELLAIHAGPSTQKQPMVLSTPKLSVKQQVVVTTTSINYSKIILNKFIKYTNNFLENFFSTVKLYSPLHRDIETKIKEKTEKKLIKLFKETPYYKLLDEFIPMIIDFKELAKLDPEEQEYILECAENRLAKRFFDFLDPKTTEEQVYRIVEEMLLKSESERNKESSSQYKIYNKNYISKEVWELVQKIREDVEDLESTGSVDAFREMGDIFQLEPEFLKNIFGTFLIEQKNTYTSFFGSDEYSSFVSHLKNSGILDNKNGASENAEITPKDELIGYISSCIEKMIGTAEVNENNKIYLRGVLKEIQKFEKGSPITDTQLLVINLLLEEYESLLANLNDSFNDVINQINYIKSCRDLLQEMLLHPEKPVLSLIQYVSVADQFKELHDAHTTQAWQKMLEFYKMQLLCNLEALNDTPNLSAEEKFRKSAVYINEWKKQNNVILGMTNFVPEKFIKKLREMHDRIEKGLNNPTYISQLLGEYDEFNRKILLTLFKEYTTTSTGNLPEEIFDILNSKEVKPGPFSTEVPIENKVLWNLLHSSSFEEIKKFFNSWELGNKGRWEDLYRQLLDDLNPASEARIKANEFLEEVTKWLWSRRSTMHQSNEATAAFIDLMRREEFKGWEEFVKNDEKLNEVLITSEESKELALHKLKQIFTAEESDLSNFSSEDSKIKTYPYSEEFKERAKELYYQLLNRQGTKEERLKLENLVSKFLNLPRQEKLINYEGLHERFDVIREDFPWMIDVINAIENNIEIERRTGVSLRPVLIVSPPGIGKNLLIARITKALGLNFRTISLAELDDSKEASTLNGVPWHYSGSNPGRFVNGWKYLNDIVFFDELGRGKKFWNNLLNLLDPEANDKIHNNFFDTDLFFKKINYFLASNTKVPTTHALASRLNTIVVAPPTVEQKFDRFKKEFYSNWNLIKDAEGFNSRVVITDKVLRDLFNLIMKVNPRDKGLRSLLGETTLVVNRIFDITQKLPPDVKFQITEDKIAQLVTKKTHRVPVPITDSLSAITVDSLTLKIPPKEPYIYGEDQRPEHEKQKRLAEQHEKSAFNARLKERKETKFSYATLSFKTKINDPTQLFSQEQLLTDIEHQIYSIRFKDIPKIGEQYKTELQKYLNPVDIEFILSNGSKKSLNFQNGKKTLALGKNILETLILNPRFDAVHNRYNLDERDDKVKNFINFIMAKINEANKSTQLQIPNSNNADGEGNAEEIALTKLAVYIMNIDPWIHDNLKRNKTEGTSSSVTFNEGTSSSGPTESRASSNTGAGNSSHTETRTSGSSGSSSGKSETFSKHSSMSTIESLDQKILLKKVVDFLEEMMTYTETYHDDALESYTTYDVPGKKVEPEKLRVKGMIDISQEEYLEIIENNWYRIKKVIQEHNIPSILLFNELEGVLKKIDIFLKNNEISIKQTVRIQLLASEINTTLEKEKEKYPILHQAMDGNLASKSKPYEKKEEIKLNEVIKDPEAQIGLRYNNIRIVCQTLMNATPFKNLTWEEYERRAYWEYKIDGFIPIEPNELKEYKKKIEILKIKIKQLVKVKNIFRTSHFDESNKPTQKNNIMQELGRIVEEIETAHGVRVTLPFTASKIVTFVNVTTDEKPVKAGNFICSTPGKQKACQYKGSGSSIIGDRESIKTSYPNITDWVNDWSIQMREERYIKATQEALIKLFSKDSNSRIKCISSEGAYRVSHDVPTATEELKPESSIKVSHNIVEVPQYTVAKESLVPRHAQRPPVAVPSVSDAPTDLLVKFSQQEESHFPPNEVLNRYDKDFAESLSCD